MPDTTIRQIAMLSLIPGRPGKTTARELHDKLKTQGQPIHVRSIERDLQKLSSVFPLVSDNAKPAGWSWQSGGTQLSVPAMDLTTALTYELLARYLKPILPRGMLKQLDPYFRQARRTLDMLQAAPLGRWSKRIAVLPWGHQLIPPEIEQNVSDVVYEALLNGKRFEASYRSLDANEHKQYVINPLGLVYRQGVMYLVATLWDYSDIRQLALHRMSGAKLRDEAASNIKGFDFERYVREEKSFDFPAGKNISLELVVEPWLARHLEECRLSEHQVITAIRNSKSFRVSATVAETEQLYWWLCGLGTNVEVKKPMSLRQRIGTLALEVAAKYR